MGPHAGQVSGHVIDASVWYCMAISVSEYIQNWIPQCQDALLLLILESLLIFCILTHSTCPSVTRRAQSC